jgi:hypothetical protein
LDVQRAAFHNLNEYDPQVLDVEAWMDYWASLHPQLFVVSCAGLMAFYPSRVPHHPRSGFLGDRDVFGEYFRAAKKRGMRVIARLESNWAKQEVLDARPDWFERDESGAPVAQGECPWIYHTCMYSSFHTEQIPAIMREVASLYDVDGFFTNSWPDTAKPRRCICDACRQAPIKPAAAFHRHEQRILEICRTLQATASETRADRFYAIHIGGGIRSALSLHKLSEHAPILIADHQGRSDNTPIWDCAQQGRAAKACMGRRPVVLGTGVNGSVWRHTAKSDAELTMWLAQANASGMAPRYTWLGSMPEDERWRSNGTKFFAWLARHEEHFRNVETVANLGVVFSQRTNALYRPPSSLTWGYEARSGDPTHSEDASTFVQGMYYALLEGRFVFDFVHEDNLVAEVLNRYAALLLPNIALLSDAQCRQLTDYVHRGGSLLATFESGMYDEDGNPRIRPALYDLFEVSYAGPRAVRNGATFYARVERSHELLHGFDNTHWLPGGEHRIPLMPVENPVLTVVRAFPQGIPEMVYAHDRVELSYKGPESDEPAVVIRERGKSRLIYFSGDVDRSAWQSGNRDFSRLLQNAVRWLTRDKTPVRVTGSGMAEVFMWKTEVGFSVHLLNYNNPQMTRGSIRTLYPLGPQHVWIELPAGARVKNVQLLRAERTIPYQQQDKIVEFDVPSVVDYEVAALLCHG